jgi:hypothetical protein
MNVHDNARATSHGRLPMVRRVLIERRGAAAVASGPGINLADGSPLRHLPADRCAWQGETPLGSVPV